MAVYRQYRETKETYVVSLPSSTNIVELEKAISSVEGWYQNTYGDIVSDDAIRVVSTGKELRLEFNGSTGSVGA